MLDDVALGDPLLDDLSCEPDPLSQLPRLQLLGATNRLQQIECRSSDILGDISDRYQVGDVDKRLQAG